MLLMLVLLLLFGGVLGLGASQLSSFGRAVRAAWCGSSVIVLTIATTLSAIYLPPVCALVIIALSIYQVFNLCRIYDRRMHPVYLRRVTMRTTLWLLTGQLLILLGNFICHRYSVPPYGVWLYIALCQLVIALVVLRTIGRQMGRMTTLTELEHLNDHELPTVTVAVAARNETEELNDCIASLLASTYPKLEIIVLDDCSQQPRTSEIIRSFAHEGVRFIEGTEPRDTWLAKNQAYQSLAEAASGDYLLFCGVDVRIEPDTIRKLVTYSRFKQKAMLCVMPRSTATALALVQPMRYAWELALPRRTFGRPPVLSSCWLITRKALNKAGGFKAVSRMIVPEAYFAQQQLAHDGYSFLASGLSYGVTSIKSVARQQDTAIRVLYPQLHRRPEMVLLVTLSMLSIIVLPLGLVGAALLLPDYTIAAVAAVISYGLFSVTYALIHKLAYGRIALSQLASLPFAVLNYAWLLTYSMVRYEFGEVLWRGRNVCLPVMHVTPHLPKQSAATIDSVER